MERPQGRIELLDDGSKSPEPIEASEALASLVATSALLSRGRDPMDLSFSSILLAFLVGGDPISLGFRKFAEESGLRVETLLQKRGLKSLDELQRVLESRSDERERVLAEPITRSVSARQAFDRARDIQRQISGADAPELEPRHLLAAFVALPTYDASYHPGDYRALAVERAAWGASFVHDAIELAPAERAGWLSFYRETFPGLTLPERAIGMSRAHFHADVAGGRDLIGIEREVDALAYLVTSTKVSPPLSIGLFGNWGSGKTFYMQMLRRRIREISDAARSSTAPQQEISCVKHVAQIDFNAWNYSGGGKLWPSLMENIFRNLNLGSEDDALGKQRDRLLADIEQKDRDLGLANERVEEVQREVTDKEACVEQLERARDESVAEVARLSGRSALDIVATRVKVEPKLQDAAKAFEPAKDVRRDARKLRASLRASRDEALGTAGLVRGVLGSGDPLRLFVVVAVVALPLILPALVELLRLFPEHPLAARLGAFATGLVGLMATTTRTLDRYRSEAGTRRTQIQELLDEVDRAIEEQQAKAAASHNQALAQERERLEALKVEHEAALRAKLAAEQKLAELRNELARTSVFFRLGAFVQDRAESSDYRKHLGMRAIIRRDFDALSNLVSQQNTKLLEGSPAEPTYPLNRIVLYIDDLDRCSEELVAEVLQAVHLLLAFPLFVVVVGVDARWIARCLRQRHPELLRDDERDADADADDEAVPPATTLDYLEKIFQIPIWLRPMGEPQRVHMVQALLGDSGGRSPTPKRADAAKPPAVPGDAAPDPAPPRTEPEQSPTTVNSEPASTTVDTRVELNPPGLEISKRERSFVQELAPLLSHSPRILKRFVNTYRLVKVGLPPELQRGFVGDAPDAPYGFCMFELAVFASMPRVARLLSRVVEENRARTIGELAETLQRGPAPLAGPDLERWRTVGAWLAARPWKTTRVEELALWTERVARYAFRID